MTPSRSSRSREPNEPPELRQPSEPPEPSRPLRSPRRRPPLLHRWLARVRDRWRGWRDARDEYRASVEEMRFHVEQETEHNIRRGMTPRSARRAALRAFGGVDRFAEQARDERPGTRWSEFRMSYLDWKLGARMMLRYPGLSLIGGITLAAAIGMGAAWFEVSLSLFRPGLPLDEGDRIVRLEYHDPATQRLEQRIQHDFMEWRDVLTTVQQLGAHRTFERNLAAPGVSPRVVRIAEISASAFDVARVPPLLGRPLIAADEAPSADDVVVIGYAAWQRDFGGDRTVVGTDVQLGRTRATVVGVMPEHFAFPLNHQYWVPLRVAPVAPLEGAPIQVFARLRPGATRQEAEAELGAWTARMAQTSPSTHALLQAQVTPFALPREPGEARREAFLITVAAWLVLIAACANVAALMFARTALREGEIVVRSALGASRARVMGQLFTEALVLTSVASVLGLIGAKAAIELLIRTQAKNGTPLPFWIESGIEPITILYTALLAVVGAAMVALLPALRATGPHVRAGLARIGSGGTSIRFGRVWSTMIVLQVAFSAVFLPFAVAAAGEIQRDSRHRSAFPADGFLTFRFALDAGDDADAPDGPLATNVAPASDNVDRMDAVLAELSDRLLAEPEVLRAANVSSASNAAGATPIAVTRELPGTYHPLHRIEVQHGTEPPFILDTNTDGNRVRIGHVGAAFFAAFDRRLVAGREFDRRDVAAASGVVINESLAHAIGGNPIGVRVRVAESGGDEAGAWHEIIGVVANFGLTPREAGEAEFMYFPTTTADASYAVLRIDGDADAFAGRLRMIALAVEPSLRLYDVFSLREAFRRYDRPTMQGLLAGLAVLLLAITLAAASLQALMSVAVTVRTREIGIRLAIGARPGAVLATLFRRAATQVGIGIVIGNVVVLLMLRSMMETVRAGAVLPPMLIGSAVMLLVGVGACLVPARRALRVQPTDALKT